MVAVEARAINACLLTLKLVVIDVYGHTTTLQQFRHGRCRFDGCSIDASKLSTLLKKTVTTGRILHKKEPIGKLRLNQKLNCGGY